MRIQYPKYVYGPYCCNGCGMQRGTLTPSDIWFRPFCGRLAYALMLRPDFPSQCYDLDTELDIHKITRSFHGAFATVWHTSRERFTLPDTWFRSPVWDLHVPQL